MVGHGTFTLKVEDDFVFLKDQSAQSLCFLIMGKNQGEFCSLSLLVRVSKSDRKSIQLQSTLK